MLTAEGALKQEFEQIPDLHEGVGAVVAEEEIAGLGGVFHSVSFLGGSSEAVSILIISQLYEFFNRFGSLNSSCRKNIFLMLTDREKCGIIIETNHDRRNQLTAEDIGSFMLFQRKIVW